MTDDNIRQGELLRDEALERLEEAHKLWISQALDAVHGLASRRDQLTTDAIWHVVGSPPKEPRAMGAVMRKAASRGWIKATDRTKLSVRPECHRRPIRIWDSLIYELPPMFRPRGRSL